MMVKKSYIIFEKKKIEKGKIITASIEILAKLDEKEADELFDLIYKWFDKKYNRRKKK